MPDAPRPGNAPQAPARHIFTDLESLEQRAKEMSDQNMRFRSWIKFHCDLSEEELDAQVNATAEEVWSHIDCVACGQCCRVLNIVVKPREITRLAKQMGIPTAEFARRYVHEDEDGEKSLNPPCPFLDGNACSIYADRPQACRDFPYLHTERFRHRMLFFIEYSLLCPVIFNTLEALKHKMPWRKRGKQRRG